MPLDNPSVHFSVALYYVILGESGSHTASSLSSCPQCPGQDLRPCHSCLLPHREYPHVVKACGPHLLTSLEFLSPDHYRPSWSNYFCIFPGLCSGLLVCAFVSLMRLFILFSWCSQDASDTEEEGSC